MEKVYIMEHPLIQHKISMLRDKNTGTNEFRKLVEEIAWDILKKSYRMRHKSLVRFFIF